MSTKARLASLAVKMDKVVTPVATPGKPAPKAQHGEKGDYLKLTVTLPPQVYELIMAEVTRRKVAKEPEPAISAIIRDAVLEHFSK